MDFPCFGAINSFWLGRLSLAAKELTIGAAIATFSYVENFIYPMKYILLDVNYIHSTKETVANLEGYLAGQVLSEQVPSYPNVTALEVREVAYHVGELAVADFSYRFDKGKKYAIIGPSASGKSTFYECWQENWLWTREVFPIWKTMFCMKWKQLPPSISASLSIFTIPILKAMCLFWNL